MRRGGSGGGSGSGSGSGSGPISDGNGHVFKEEGGSSSVGMNMSTASLSFSSLHGGDGSISSSDDKSEKDKNSKEERMPDGVLTATPDTPDSINCDYRSRGGDSFKCERTSWLEVAPGGTVNSANTNNSIAGDNSVGAGGNPVNNNVLIGSENHDRKACNTVASSPSGSPQHQEQGKQGLSVTSSPASLYGKFTWKIENFSEINKRELRSKVFEVGSYKWYILIYPQGCDVYNHLSLFLCVADYDKLLPGWNHFAQFTIAVVNKDPKKSKYSDTLHRFCKKEHDWGWKKFMELSKVLDGFTVANALVIKAQVQVIRDTLHRPFRCLDSQYRRELVRVYLQNVESLCRRFLDEKRASLVSLKDEQQNFCEFWDDLSFKQRENLSKENTDLILKAIVKRFFNEREVTSTLVMDALFSGCQSVDVVSKIEETIEKGQSVISLLQKQNETQSSFALRGRIDKILDRMVDEMVLSGYDQADMIEEYGTDAIERDERRLADIGKKTIELFVVAFIFTNKIEVAYRENLALKRAQALILEEENEAAERAASQKAEKDAREKKRDRKKLAKQRKRERKNEKELADANGKSTTDASKQDEEEKNADDDDSGEGKADFAADSDDVNIADNENSAEPDIDGTESTKDLEDQDDDEFKDVIKTDTDSMELQESHINEVASRQIIEEKDAEIELLRDENKMLQSRIQQLEAESSTNKEILSSKDETIEDLRAKIKSYEEALAKERESLMQYMSSNTNRNATQSATGRTRQTDFRVQSHQNAQNSQNSTAKISRGHDDTDVYQSNKQNQMSVRQASSPHRPRQHLHERTQSGGNNEEVRELQTVHVRGAGQSGPPIGSQNRGAQKTHGHAGPRNMTESFDSNGSRGANYVSNGSRQSSIVGARNSGGNESSGHRQPGAYISGSASAAPVSLSGRDASGGASSLKSMSSVLASVSTRAHATMTTKVVGNGDTPHHKQKPMQQQQQPQHQQQTQQQSQANQPTQPTKPTKAAQAVQPTHTPQQTPKSQQQHITNHPAYSNGTIQSATEVSQLQKHNVGVGESPGLDRDFPHLALINDLLE